MVSENSQAIRSYLSILDKIRKNYSPLVWWGSFIASKDRFYSEIQHQYFSKLDYPESKHLYHIFKFPFYVLIEWWKIIQTKYYCQRCRLNPEENLQIIKSFCYEQSFIHGEFKDPMFQGLQDNLNKSTSIKTITICSPLGNLKKILKSSNQVAQEIYPIYLFNKRSDILIVSYTILKNIFSILWTKKKTYDHLEKKIHSQLFLSQFSYMNVLGLYHYLAFQHLIKKFKIKKLIYTYENNIWEKMMILQFRTNSPNTKIIGHLHSAVPEAAINFFISEEEEKNAPLPDKIVTTGVPPAEILKEYGNYSKNQIEIGGSFKFSNSFTQVNHAKEIKKTILIGMEGIPQSLEMVNYTLSELEKMPDWNVILRTHPILPLGKIKSKLKYSKNLEQRLEFSSTNKLTDDFNKSGVMIYWGSTLCFEAIVHGVPLINYKRDHRLNFDPLFKLEKFKKNVSSKNSLIKVLNEIIQTPINEIHHEQDEAFCYVRSYLSEINDELIQKNYGK